MEEDFRALLTGSAAVTALVPATRINWGEHPQGVGYPAVVMTGIGGSETLTMQGPDGLLSARVQVDCYATTYGNAKTISRQVITVLSGRRQGAMRLVEHVATRDSREGGTNEAERPYRVSLDFMAHWRATT